jgi:hypothetical protein
MQEAGQRSDLIFARVANLKLFLIVAREIPVRKKENRGLPAAILRSVLGRIVSCWDGGF